MNLGEEWTEKCHKDKRGHMQSEEGQIKTGREVPTIKDWQKPSTVTHQSSQQPGASGKTINWDPVTKTKIEMARRRRESLGQETCIHFPRGEFKEEQKAACGFNLESFSWQPWLWLSSDWCQKQLFTAFGATVQPQSGSNSCLGIDSGELIRRREKERNANLLATHGTLGVYRADA